MKLKMTHSDIENNRLAGLVYEVPQVEAQKYLDEHKAIIWIDETVNHVELTLRPSKKKVNDGDR